MYPFLEQYLILMRIRHPTLTNKQTFHFLIWLNVNEYIDFEPTQHVVSHGFAIYLTSRFIFLVPISSSYAG